MEGKQKIRIVATSDTHNYYPALPQGDMFIHCGDLTSSGSQRQLLKLISYLQSLKFKHKIVVAGNHDLSLDQDLQKMPQYSPQQVQRNRALKEELKKHCTYLQHEKVSIQGISIFGSPYTPQFYDWAFMYSPAKAKQIWAPLDKGIDILITHGPPEGIMDQVDNHLPVGCPELRARVEQIKPKLHFFGHIHQQYGKDSNGVTTFYNCAHVNIRYKPCNAPWVVDYVIGE